MHRQAKELDTYFNLLLILKRLLNNLLLGCQMRNPYIFGYLPFVTIMLFSLTFGFYTVGQSITLFKEIGLYTGMREFLTDIQLGVFLLVISSLLYFMIFAALKVIAETIHETAMLLFSKDVEGISYSKARGGNVIYFFGALSSLAGIHSIMVLGAIFLVTTLVYFIYVVSKLSKFMTTMSMIGLLFFEIIVWSVLISVVVYILLKLYNGVIASLPLIN